MQNLSAPFIFQEECHENRACSVSIGFFKITDPCVGRSFSMCSHDPIFGTNKNRILKADRVNGPLKMFSLKFTKVGQALEAPLKPRCSRSWFMVDNKFSLTYSYHSSILEKYG